MVELGASPNGAGLTEGRCLPGQDLLEKVILGELEGKNRAIHAYDDIVWKIRSGFLTLLFGGWSILVKSLLDQQVRPPDLQLLVFGLFLFSAGLAYGARSIDRNYIHRKFRVIYALDHLMDQINSCAGDYRKIPPELLRVAGDNPQAHTAAGFGQALRVELSVYLVPLLIVAVGLVLIVK